MQLYTELLKRRPKFLVSILSSFDFVTKLVKSYTV